MQLADLGARVIKVESYGGDDSRKFGPFIKIFQLILLHLIEEKNQLN